MISLDANVFIYYIEDSPEFGEVAADIFKRVMSEGGCLSSLVFAEFEAGRKPGVSKADNLLKFIDGLIARGSLTVVDITRLVATKAGAIRRENPKVTLADALHMACALQAGSTSFYTNDRELIGLSAVETLTIYPLV